MARPSKFNLERGRVIVEALATGQSRPAAAKAAGIGFRTLGDWIARGRSGDPAFGAWLRQLDAAETCSKQRRVEAWWDRYRVSSKERWQRFRASREAWWLEQLGPLEFWKRRVGWLVTTNRTRNLGAAVVQLRAAGFRINRTP